MRESTGDGGGAVPFGYRRVHLIQLASAERCYYFSIWSIWQRLSICFLSSRQAEQRYATSRAFAVIECEVASVRLCNLTA